MEINKITGDEIERMTYFEDPEGPGVHEDSDSPLPGCAPDTLLHRLPVAIVDPLPLGHHVTVHVTGLLPVSLQEVLLRSQVTPGQVQPVSWIIVNEDVVPFIQKSGEDSLLLGLFVSVIGRYGLEV